LDGVPSDQITPVAYLVEQSASSVIPGHYHRTAQFQVFVKGDGMFGVKPVQGPCIHYAAAFTPYAPIRAGGERLQYFVFRLAFDPGAQWMPECKEQLRTIPRNPRAEFGALDLASPEDSGFVGKPEVSEVIPLDANGLGAWLHRLRPGREGRGSTPAAGRGQFWLVLDGDCIMEGELATAGSIRFVSAEDPAVTLRAGVSGATIVGVQFARR
jgi:hypothetical protein